ncbi:MAG: M16 family metallopeptidase [Candidatus Omnitrophota bacterium]
MVERTVLDSGLVIISEYIPTFPSFDLSYTIRGGSRNETLENNGIYHMIEHMLFKGTKKYNLRDIADISDRLGGKLDAYTGKETTHFRIKAVDEYLELSFDLLTDMMKNSIFPPDEFEKEKNVILQEIHEADDSPDENAFETFYERVFGRNGLAYPVGGKIESVSAFKRDAVFEFYKKVYTPDNMLLATIGKAPHEQIVAMAQQAFSDYPSKKPANFVFDSPQIQHSSFSKQNNSLNQVYVIIGFDGLSMTAPLRHRYMILNDILGAGMSSRLFQRIREEKGLSYTISSFNDAYQDCGLHVVYSTVEPMKVNEYQTAVNDEIARLKSDGITEEELKRAKDSIKSSIILGFESRMTKLRFNVNNELFIKKNLSLEEIITNINETTVDDINRLFNEHLDLDHMSVFLYGDLRKRK